MSRLAEPGPLDVAQGVNLVLSLKYPIHREHATGKQSCLVRLVCLRAAFSLASVLQSWSSICDWCPALAAARNARLSICQPRPPQQQQRQERRRMRTCRTCWMKSASLDSSSERAKSTIRSASIFVSVLSLCVSSFAVCAGADESQSARVCQMRPIQFGRRAVLQVVQVLALGMRFCFAFCSCASFALADGSCR